MGSVNSTGIYEYDRNDIGPGPGLLNLQSAALTTLLGSQTLVKRVADVTERNSYAASQAPVTVADPCLVWRADADPGQNFEFSVNGTLWDSIPAATLLLMADDNFQMGSISTGALTAGTIKDVPLTFPKPFAGTPRLFLTVYNQRAGSLSVSYNSRSTTGANLRAWSSGNLSSGFNVHWLGLHFPGV